MNKTHSVYKILKRSAELVSALAFLAMFGTFLLQVFMRYVIGKPLIWSLEFDVVSYVWIVFWTASFLVREQEHIRFNMLYDAASPAARRVMAIVITLALAAAFFLAIPATYDYVTFMVIEDSPVLGWRLDFVFSIFLIFVVVTVLRSLLRLWDLFSRDWRAHI